MGFWQNLIMFHPLTSLKYPLFILVDERGRWWVVGSAWTGEKPPEERDLKPIKNADEAFSDQLRALAKKQRMNTENRRTVFCIIMSAEVGHSSLVRL